MGPTKPFSGCPSRQGGTDYFIKKAPVKNGPHSSLRRKSGAIRAARGLRSAAREIRFETAVLRRESKYVVLGAGAGADD